MFVSPVFTYRRRKFAVQKLKILRSVVVGSVSPARPVTLAAAVLALLLACGASVAEPQSLQRRNPETREIALAKCAAEDNCISSTAVGNPSKYGPPWSYAKATADPGEAWSSLEAAVRAEPGLEVQKVQKYYLYATGPSVFPPGGVDDIEFLMRPMDEVVLYRSSSRKVTYVYPFLQPLGDFGTNKARLERIRNRLGWELLDFMESQ
ncbi:hypothetical protein F1559_002550 [Cyanidiococcus yangmingshanensis]|uniref:Uncharacterized protein n=1 Tax=Cyanidiococcus yangmingshanensis TaxID=2690220 RepID=A0A7J7II66_9RHOD|nr:hypothetical protein F1559_002550 [Cyanidiococcus yangmingshanensis]